MPSVSCLAIVKAGRGERFPRLPLARHFATVAVDPMETAMPRLPVLVLVLAAVPAWAEPAPDGPGGAAAALVAAHRAHEAALRGGEVFALLAAIRMAREVTLRPATGWERTTEGEASADAPTGATGPVDPGGEAALTIARNLAGENPDLQDLVYALDAQLPGEPGQTAVVATGALAPGQTDSWRLPLFGKVPAELAVLGDGDAPLSISLTDEDGRVLCAHPPTTGPALCRIMPARNAFFTVTIRNAGLVVNDYRLVGS
jgi:hypothetical protein